MFIRHSEPIQLTFKGKKILDLAYTILDKVTVVESELIDIESARLNIAIECHACFDWLIPTLDVFKILQPRVDVDLSMAFSFEPLEALKNYAIDMVVTSDTKRTKEFTYFPIFEYQMLLVMAKQNSLFKKKCISPSDLQHQTLLTYPVNRNRLDVFNYFLTPANVVPEKIRTVELPLMMMRLIHDNQGVATMPQWALSDEQKNKLCVRPLGKKGIWRTLFLAVRNIDSTLPYIADFVSTAKQISFENLSNIHELK